ncbi:MAG: Nramp family divalent metal transporter [Bacteroidota bacterium]
MSLDKKQLLKTLGPGLLFASTCIGTSHLVLATRAGAHYGMVYFWIILLAHVLKYPFYEFGPRYANATGFSLLKGYREQGKWAVYLFLLIILISMFAVNAATAAVSAGLLSTLLGLSDVISVPMLSGVILAVSTVLLLVGGYAGLDGIIKIISIVLLVTVCVAFGAVLVKGPVTPAADFQAPDLLDAAGLALLIGLIGWMPTGMEVSTMNSIWNVEKTKSTGYYPKLKETLADYNIGYILSTVLGLMFLVIGAYTVYGSGNLLTGNATQFTQQLLSVFTTNLGQWSYYVVATAAFGTIYGTLLTVLDAFPRCFVGGIRVLKYENTEQNEEQGTFLQKSYRITVITLGIGAFLLFYFSAAGMVKLLDVVTIISFLVSPFIAYFNLRAIQSSRVPESHKPSRWMIILSYLGLAFLVGFALFYLSTKF